MYIQGKGCRRRQVLRNNYYFTHAHTVVSQSSGKGGLCSCCSSRQGAYDIADGGRRPRGVFLNLRKVAHDWSEGRKPSVTRSSNLVPEFGMAEPDFRDAPPTTGDVGSSLSNRSRAAPVRKVTIQEDWVTLDFFITLCFLCQFLLKVIIT